MDEPISALKGPGPLGKTSILKNLHNHLRNVVSANKVKNLRKGEKFPDYDLHLLGRSHNIDSYVTSDGHTDVKSSTEDRHWKPQDR